MNKKKILITDDDPAIKDALKQILEDEGYGVETTADGSSVIKMHKELPDLLLLDIWMSGIDGRDICRELKSHEKTKHIPIIMVSAIKDTKGIAREAGADDFITKPFEIDELLKKVGQHLRD
ncbi:MAG: response regulator [Candidatus Levyibacteriota bacterium]